VHNKTDACVRERFESGPLVEPGPRKDVRGRKAHEGTHQADSQLGEESRVVGLRMANQKKRGKRKKKEYKKKRNNQRGEPFFPPLTPFSVPWPTLAINIQMNHGDLARVKICRPGHQSDCGRKKKPRPRKALADRASRGRSERAQKSRRPSGERRRYHNDSENRHPKLQRQDSV